MSRANGIADAIDLYATGDEFQRPTEEAAVFLRQQEAVIRQMLEVIEHCNAHGWMLADYEDKMYAALEAAKGVL